MEKRDEASCSREKETRNWTQFTNLFSKDLETINKAIEDSTNKCKSIQNTMDTVESLSQHAQAKACLQICPLAYVNAVVKHTGEYNVQVSPEYQCTLTKEQTIDHLDEQLAEERSKLSILTIEKEQTERRLNFNLSDVDDIPDITDMPEEIVSDQGVAFKRGSFYEIREEIGGRVDKLQKRISRVQRSVENFEKLMIEEQSTESTDED